MNKLIITFWHNNKREYDMNEYYKMEQTGEHLIIYKNKTCMEADVHYLHTITEINFK